MEEKKSEIQIKLVKNTNEKAKKEDILEILKYISPGTTLRTGIEGVLKAKTRGLIVIENDVIPEIIEGGFKVNCRFTPQRLVELCKMDGAVVLSRDMKRILFANILLTPNHSIPSNETGTRHKAAERTAKQLGTIVMAVSQRRNEITLFYKNIKYEIKETSEIIRRATEILQILEKHRDLFDKLNTELNKVELDGKVKPNNVTSLIQRGKIILKTSEILRKYIIELGIEGTIVKSRLKEILHGVDKEVNNVIKDYTKIGFKKTKRILDILNHDEILDLENIEQSLGISKEIKELIPRGHRLLTEIGMPEEDIGILIKEFKNINQILLLNQEQTNNFFGEEKSNLIMEKIDLLANHEKLIHN